MTDTPKRKRGRPAKPGPKTIQFGVRMTQERRAELERLCRLGSRPISHQIDHMLTIASLTLDFCEGNDNLKVIQERLAKAKKHLGR